MALILDTGPLYALVDRSDPWHERVVELMAGETGPLVVPTMVLPEVSYLLLKHLGPKVELAFMKSATTGELQLHRENEDDFKRAVEILEQYPDHAFGLVDAIVMASAERLRITRVATVDRRHFSAFRPRHVAAFELLP